MIKIPEKEGRLSAAKAAHIEAVIAFVKRKTEGYRRDLFANISRVMLVSGTFEDRVPGMTGAGFLILSWQM